jgi:hypothetical protein
MAQDELSAADIFTRMGNLKQRIMNTGAGAPSSVASFSAVSDLSSAVEPPPPVTTVETGPGADYMARQISDLSDSDVSELSNSKASKAESGQTQGSSALERLRAKVAMNKKAPSSRW